jgi:hypothetical protein
MGGNLLAGDIFQMLGLPSIGNMTTPLQSITDSVMGPGSYQNFQNAGTKKLLDVFLKGAIGGGKRTRRRRIKGGAEGEVPPPLQSNYADIRRMLDTLLTVDDAYFNGQPYNYFNVNLIRGHLRKNMTQEEYDTIYREYIGVFRNLYQYRNTRGADNASAYQGHGRVKVCRHKYPKRCKCPKGEGAGIFDNLKDYVKLWEPEKILGKVGDLAMGKLVKHALGGSAIAARVSGFVADPQVQKDIHKMFARAMTDMLVKHEKSGEAIPMDHPIMMELGPAISGSGRRRRVVGASWTKWLSPFYLAKRALHATHIDRIINKIPVVGNIAAATGVTGGKRPRGRPRKVRGGAAPVFDNDEADRMPQKYHIEEWGTMEPRQREDDERSEEGSVGGPMTKKERQAKYRHENREKLREKQRQYREAKKVRVI